MRLFYEKIPLGAPLEMYGADTLACIAIGDQIRPEGPGFFACSRPTAPTGSLVCPQITRCNHSPNAPSSVRASYVLSLKLTIFAWLTKDAGRSGGGLRVRVNPTAREARGRPAAPTSLLLQRSPTRQAPSLFGVRPLGWRAGVRRSVGPCW